MKKLRITLLVSALLFISLTSVKAQIGVNINFSTQPLWGPVSYDYVEYYYMPEYGIYYYAPGQQFIYRNGNDWIYANSLPYQYRNVNLYRTYKVVVNEPKPYLRNTYYANHYRRYKNYHSRQGNIRESRDPRYGREERHQGNNHGNMRQDNHRNIQQGTHRANVQQKNRRDVQPGNQRNNNVNRPQNNKQQPGNRGGNNHKQNNKGNNKSNDKGNKGNDNGNKHGK